MNESEMNDGLAKAGVGAFMAAAMDGSLGQVDPDTMDEIASSMAKDPKATAKYLGNPEALGDAITPDALYGNIMGQYLDARFTDMIEADSVEADDTVAAMRNRRQETEFTYARLSPEEIGRIQFDAENGDVSAMTKVKEKFYLG